MLWSANAASQTSAPHETLLPKVNVSNNAHLFQNTTPSSFKGANNSVVGVYGVTPKMVQLANTAGVKGTVPGWYIVKSGMGPSKSHLITGGGTLYDNTDIVLVTSTLTNTINCSATIVTSNAGVIVSLGAFSNNGGLFVNNSTTTLAVKAAGGATASVAGTGATFTFKLGGRANRVAKECLVSLGSMSNDTAASNTALWPNHA